jgi:hypothetical protein
VVIDGRDQRVSFTLESLYAVSGGNTAKPAAAAGAAKFGGIDDVGDPFAKH